MVASRILLQVSSKITGAFSASSCQFPFFPSSILGYLGIFCFPGGSVDKESACNAEDPGSTLGQEDPLEKRMAFLSSILAGEFHGQRSPVDYSLWDFKESDRTEQLTLMC